MGTVFLHGNGGSGGSGGGIGLQVVGNPRPKNPVEGTVWANTDVDITGYFLSAEQPENLAEGNLWIKISDSSNIKVGTPLGKDYITIMLNSVSQYVGGALVDVEAKSFQNGVWVDWWDAKQWLFHVDKPYTGKWVANNFKSSADPTPNVQAVLSIDSSGLNMSIPTGNWVGSVFNEELIDLAAKSTITVEAVQSKGASFGVAPSIVDNFTPLANKLNFGNGTITLDISQLTGTGYLYFSFYNGGNAQVKNIKIE